MDAFCLVAAARSVAGVFVLCMAPWLAAPPQSFCIPICELPSREMTNLKNVRHTSRSAAHSHCVVTAAAERKRPAIQFEFQTPELKSTTRASHANQEGAQRRLSRRRSG